MMYSDILLLSAMALCPTMPSIYQSHHPPLSVLLMSHPFHLKTACQVCCRLYGLGTGICPAPLEASGTGVDDAAKGRM